MLGGIELLNLSSQIERALHVVDVAFGEWSQADDLVIFLFVQVVLDGTADVQVTKRDAGTEALVTADDDVDIVVEEPVEELEFSWSEVAGLAVVVPLLGSAVHLFKVVDGVFDVLVDWVLEDVL